MKILLSFCAVFVFVSTSALAQSKGLLIHATEIGVGKFHRADNKIHPYSADNVWAPHITPENAGKDTPVVFTNPDKSITVQFSSLEELLQTVVAISTKMQTKVAVLNINGHGMPGGMWYPKDEAQRKSLQCMSWRKSAAAPDQSNYDQYYSPVSKMEIMSLRASANSLGHYACTTGAPEWKEVAGRIPNIKSFFTDDAQIHFESCLVGLGKAGENFTMTVASLLLSGANAMVKTSTNFGLGDWSMPEGMGFWDYFSDAQLAHDNEVYPKNRQDREIMKKGVIRVAHQENGQWVTSLVADQDFMLVGYQLGFSNKMHVIKEEQLTSGSFDSQVAPLSVHLPGTAVELQRMN